MKPEEKAEIILWDWLMTKSQFIEKIYFNRVNSINSPIFTIKGINKKPDFIIELNRGFGIEYIAVEIKSSEKSKNVHDGCKILMYYENYILEKTKYFIKEKEIKINHFVVATENSFRGHLFKKDDEIIKNYDNQNDEWRKINAERGFVPHYEYIRTSDFQRRLWSEWRELKKRLKLESKKLSSIGIIISNPKKEEFPYLFIMTYIDYLNSKSKWGQRFWRM